MGAYPRFQRARNFKFTTRSSGSVTATTTWANVDTSTDITIACQYGDVLEAGVVGMWDNAVTHGRLDCVIMPTGAVTNSFSGTYVAGSATTGVPAWLGPASTYQGIGASVMKQLGATDVTTAGFTTCRLVLRADAAVGKLLVAQATDVLQFWVRNLGPQDLT